MPSPQIPHNFKLSIEQSDWVITQRWYSPIIWLLIFLCLIIYGLDVLLFFIGSAFIHQFYAMSLGVIVFTLISLVIVLFSVAYASILITKSMLGTLLNKTEIRLSSEKLSVRIFPIPSHENIFLPTTDIDELYCEESEIHRRYTTGFRYDVVVIYQDGQRVNFVTKLDYPEQALFIIETTRQYLREYKLLGHEDGAIDRMQSNQERTTTDQGQMQSTDRITSPIIQEKLRVSLVASSTILFNRSGMQISWLAFGGLMILFWVYVIHSSVWSVWKFHAPLSISTGHITAITDTGAVSEYGSHPIYRLNYIFYPATCSSGEKGVSFADGYSPSIGTQVRVEYRKDNTRISRIQGFRDQPRDFIYGCLVLFFIAIPSCAIVICLLPGITALNILRRGRAVRGKLTNIQYTVGDAQGQRQYTVTFEFSPGDGCTFSSTTVTSKLKQEWRAFYEKKGSAETLCLVEEDIIYDAKNPRRNLVLAVLDQHWRMNDQRRIEGINPAIGYACAIIPLLCVLGHGGYLMWLLLK